MKDEKIMIESEKSLDQGLERKKNAKKEDVIEIVVENDIKKEVAVEKEIEVAVEEEIEVAVGTNIEEIITKKTDINFCK